MDSFQGSRGSEDLKTNLHGRWSGAGRAASRRYARGRLPAVMRAAEIIARLMGMVRGLTSRTLPPLPRRSHRTGSRVRRYLLGPQGSLTSTSHPCWSLPCSASQLRRPWTTQCALSPCHRCLDSSSTRGLGEGLLPRCAPLGARPKTRAAARRDDRARLMLIPEGSRRSPTLPSRLVEGSRVRERPVRCFQLVGGLGRGPCNRTSSSAATRSAK